MFQETFEVEVKKGKRIPKGGVEEEGSDIENDEDIIVSDVEDDEEEEVMEYLTKAFSEVAELSRMGYREYMLDFFEPNASLIEDDEDYDFDISDNIPILTETQHFLPFVNFIKSRELELTGVTLNTNLEGGGSLVI